MLHETFQLAEICIKILGVQNFKTAETFLRPCKTYVIGLSFRKQSAAFRRLLVAICLSNSFLQLCKGICNVTKIQLIRQRVAKLYSIIKLRLVKEHWPKNGRSEGHLARFSKTVSLSHNNFREDSKDGGFSVVNIKHKITAAL